MSSELEKAIERYKQKKQEDQQLAEQQRAAQETAEQERIDRINADFERVVAPVLERFWSENIPQELVDLFDEYAQRLRFKMKQRIGLQRRLGLEEPQKSRFLYEEPYEEPSPWGGGGVTWAKEQVLQILNEVGWKNLELDASYQFDETFRRSHHLQTQYLFGFSVTSENPSSVHWWTGGGDKKIDGEYTRTPESLEKIVNDLAVALNEGIFTYYSAPSAPSYERGLSISGSD